MKHTITSRIAALGAVVALGSAALVSAGPAAQAAAPSGDYTCTTGLGDYAVTVTPKAKLPAKATKGRVVPAKKITMKVVLSQELTDGLRLLGVKSLSGEANGAKLKVGSAKVALVGVAFKDTAVPASGTMTVKAVGKTAAFTPKKAGVLKVVAPKSFLFSSTKDDGQALTTDAPCSASGKPVTLGSVKVK